MRNAGEKRIALMKSQVIDWDLPPAPAKVGDTRTKNWGGLGQVELDAVRPEQLMKLLQGSLEDIFDRDLHADLLVREDKERKIYQKTLKEIVGNM